jgi:hypothetical protein
MIPTEKSFFAGKNDDYFEFFKRSLALVKQTKLVNKHKQKAVEVIPTGTKHRADRATFAPSAPLGTPVQPSNTYQFSLDDDEMFSLGRKNEFDMWGGASATSKPPVEVVPDPPVSELTDEQAKRDQKNNLKLKKKILKLKRQRNLLNNKSPHIPELPSLHIPEPYYDYQQLDFKFTPQELEAEPVPGTMWIHMSCMYWVPEVYFNNSQFPIDVRNLKGIEKERFKKECSICGGRKGACVKCSADACEITFHVECARRSKVHLEMVTEYQTKFNIHCAAHTPRLLSNLIASNCRRTQEEVAKFYKYLQRILRSQDIPLSPAVAPDTAGDRQVDEVSEANFSLEAGEAESEDDSKVPRQKIEISQLTRFLSERSRAVVARVRKHVLQRPHYQFTVCLKRTPDAPDEYEFVTSAEPLKLLYKNFVHKRDHMWLDMRRRNEEGMPLLHDRFKYLVNLLKSVKRRANEYLRRNEKGNLVLMKPIESDCSAVIDLTSPEGAGESQKDQSEFRCEKCLQPWDHSNLYSVGYIISLRHLQQVVPRGLFGTRRCECRRTGEQDGHLREMHPTGTEARRGRGGGRGGARCLTPLS